MEKEKEKTDQQLFFFPRAVVTGCNAFATDFVAEERRLDSSSKWILGNYQVAQLQRNCRARRISAILAFLPILATMVLEFRILLTVNVHAANVRDFYLEADNKLVGHVPMELSIGT